MYRTLLLMLVGAGTLLAVPATAAMYKWVDERGVTHYSDRIPPQYQNRASQTLTRTGVKAPTAPSAAQPPAPAAQSEQQQVDAKRDLEQQRQDLALMASYANEQEIELARERELKRVQDILSMASAGLNRSNDPGDRRKLDALINQAREQTDAINARYDARKARYAELKDALPAAAGARAAAKP